MFNMSIPILSDEELINRYKFIKPVITLKGVLYHLREYTLEELKTLSYPCSFCEDVQKEVDKDELEVLEGKDFVCLHKYGHSAIFRPKISEVLSQIRPYDLLTVKAFEIIETPNSTNNIYKNSFTSIAFDNGYHVSTVRLYIAKR